LAIVSGIDGPERQVFGHPFDEPQRQARCAVLSRRRVWPRRHVELERMHEFVSDHVVGIRQRTAKLRCAMMAE
jgi:hypothetical protein